MFFVVLCLGTMIFGEEFQWEDSDSLFSLVLCGHCLLGGFIWGEVNP